MIKKKKIIISLVLIAFSFVAGYQVNAEVGGGQVSTMSGITFFKGDEQDKPIPNDDKKDKTIKNDDEKKIGFLPKTGEKMEKFLPLLIGIILTIFVIVLLKRGKKI